MALWLSACSKGAPAPAAAPAATPAPTVFSADSAMAMLRAQTDFGPRVPGSGAHLTCRQWLCSTLVRLGADTVIVQEGAATAYDGTTVPLNNIIARFNPAQSPRILLAAHYDTRPWADRDPDPERRSQPLDGANDGASGVAVLLETARCLSTQAPDAGVDIIFFDTEDYGAPADSGADGGWCLGSQYWSTHPVPYTGGNLPQTGILLDMVGARGARFLPEAHSAAYAPATVSKILRAANAAGYGSYFPTGNGPAIVDDHIYMLAAGIPSADIIDAAHPATGSFPPQWHTHADNVENIDPATLRAVGATILKLISDEFPQN